MNCLPAELIGKICWLAADPVYQDCNSARAVWPKQAASYVCRRWWWATRHVFLANPVLRSVDAAQYVLQYFEASREQAVKELALMFPASKAGDSDDLTTRIVRSLGRVETLKLVRTVPTELEHFHAKSDLERLIMYQSVITRPGYGFEGALVLNGLTELSLSIDEYLLNQCPVTLFLLPSVMPNLQALAYQDPAQTSVTPDSSMYDLIDRTLILKLKYFSAPFDAKVIQDPAAFDASRTLVDFWMHDEPKEGAHLVERELGKVQYLRLSTNNEVDRHVQRDWSWIDETISKHATALRAIVMPAQMDEEEAKRKLPRVYELVAKGLVVLFDDADENDVSTSRISRSFWKWRRPMSFGAK